MRGAVLISLLCGLMLTLTAKAQEYYRWHDEKGQLHVSQTPPPAHIDYEIVAPGAAPEPVKAKAAKNPAATKPVSEAELQTLKQQVSEVNARLKLQNCSRAQQNKDRLSADSAVAFKDASGKPVALSDEMRAEQLAVAERQISEFCTPAGKQ